MSKPILLFDLGGVLVDLAKPAEAIGLDMTEEEFWGTWLTSPLVRSFETGQLSTAEFVSQLGAEFGFDDAAEFDRALRRWHLPMFSGAEKALRSLTESHTVALLSNTNEIHWNHVDAQTDVFGNFAKLFLSYETGNAKPSAAAFHDVVQHFDCEPGQIIFFDDNEANIVAARQEGLNAVHAQGWSNVEFQVERVL
ncbi:MAG: HAD family hydrolase [Woeseiaceae bacterium]